jgi:hypothetical protein
MSDFIQNLLVALLVLVALAYAGRHLWRSMQAGKPGGGCGCGAKKACGASAMKPMEQRHAAGKNR